MDAFELLRGDATFVADTSAWWRALTLPEVLGGLLEEAIRDDRMLITPIVRMEILYSARTSTEYVSLEAEPDALRILRSDRAVADAAVWRFPHDPRQQSGHASVRARAGYGVGAIEQAHPAYVPGG